MRLLCLLALFGALALPAAAETVEFEFHIGWKSGPLEGEYTHVSGSYDDSDVSTTGADHVNPEDDDLEFEFTIDGTTYTEADDVSEGDSPVWPSLKIKNGEIVAMKFNGEDFYINGRTTTYEGSDGTSTGGAAIPEPATAALLIAGAAMFVAVRRRRD